MLDTRCRLSDARLLNRTSRCQNASRRHQDRSVLTLFCVGHCIFYCVYKTKCSTVAEMGDRLSTIDVGGKLGAVPFSGKGSWVPI